MMNQDMQPLGIRSEEFQKYFDLRNYFNNLVRSYENFPEMMDEMVSYMRSSGIFGDSDTFTIYRVDGRRPCFHYVEGEHARDALVPIVVPERSIIGEAMNQRDIVVADVRNPDKPLTVIHPKKTRDTHAEYYRKPARITGRQFSYITAIPHVMGNHVVGGSQFMTGYEPDINMLLLFRELCNDIFPYAYMDMCESTGTDFRHDLKNLATISHAYAAMARSHGYDEPDKIKAVLEGFVELADHLDVVVDHYYRGLVGASFSLSDVGRKIAQKTITMGELNGVVVALDQSGIQNLDPIRMDGDLLVQRLFNIPRNLLYIWEKGQHPAFMEVRTYESDDKKYHILEIADRAGGVPYDIRNAFLKKSVSTKGRGRGDGMVSLRAAVTQHEGNITYHDVEDERGKGTVFKIEIPTDLKI